LKASTDGKLDDLLDPSNDIRCAPEMVDPVIATARPAKGV